MTCLAGLLWCSRVRFENGGQGRFAESTIVTEMALASAMPPTRTDFDCPWMRPCMRLVARLGVRFQLLLLDALG